MCATRATLNLRNGGQLRVFQLSQGRGLWCVFVACSVQAAAHTQTLTLPIVMDGVDVFRLACAATHSAVFHFCRALAHALTNGHFALYDHLQRKAGRA